MNANDLKESYGEEYPAAVIFDGVRLPLQRETRFLRNYYSSEHKLGYQISRFMDGTASMTVAQLQSEWARWEEHERLEFCQMSTWLHEQPDYPDMLRFIMEHSGPREWSAIALDVAGQFPVEGFDVLLRWLRSSQTKSRGNLIQAIAYTKHPGAEAVLRQELRSLWANSFLWNDDPFINWVAHDATTCIKHLLELGAAPAEFETEVRRLSEHICSRNGDLCKGHLSKYYAWLK